MIVGMHTCAACGSDDVFAIHPGTEPEHADAPLLFALDRGEPMRAWCEACWRARFLCVEESA